MFDICLSEFEIGIVREERVGCRSRKAGAVLAFSLFPECLKSVPCIRGQSTSRMGHIAHYQHRRYKLTGPESDGRRERSAGGVARVVTASRRFLVKRVAVLIKPGLERLDGAVEVVDRLLVGSQLLGKLVDDSL
jgi:hypothetical protein